MDLSRFQKKVVYSLKLKEEYKNNKREVYGNFSFKEGCLTDLNSLSLEETRGGIMLRTWYGNPDLGGAACCSFQKITEEQVEQLSKYYK